MIPRHTAAWALLIGLLGTACGGGTTRRQPEQPAVDTSRLQTMNLGTEFFEAGATDTIRFGRLFSGEIARLQFRIANRSDRPTAIHSYERNCGCTTLEFQKEPIAPGAAQTVGITFDSRGTRGWQLKIVEIRMAGGRKPLKIFVEAEVE